MNWRRILLLSIALVSVLGITTWAMLQNSDFATEFVRRRLNEAFATRAEISATSINLEAGQLTISGLELGDPTHPERTLARVATTKISAQADLFGAGVQLRHISLEAPEFECGPSWPTLTDLLQPRADEPGTSTPIAIPVIEVHDGKAQVHLSEGERAMACTDVGLTVVPLASDATKLQIHGTLTVVEPMAKLQIDGEVDIETGAATLTVSTAKVQCSQQVVAYLTRLARVDLDDVQVGGHIDALSVTCSIPPTSAADRTPAFKVLAKCSDLQVDAKDLPSIVRHARVTLFTDTADAGHIRATIEQHNETGDLSITTRIDDFLGEGPPTFDLLANGRNVRVDEDSIAALRTFGIGRGVVEALRPTAGRGDIDLYLKDPARPGGIAEMDLALRECAMTYQGFGAKDNRIGFPLQLEGGSGNVHLRGKTLLLKDIKASIPEEAGDGELTLDGRIDLSKPPRESTRLDIDSESVAFSDDLAAALATLLGDGGDLYERLAPSGRSKVHVAVRPQSELTGGFFVEIQPEGAAMSWEGFPYPLDDLRGSIRVRSTDARFDLTGRHGDGGLSMRGRIPLRSDHRPEEGFEAVIVADQLRLDDDLRFGVARVVPELEEHWRAAEPSGRISGEVKVWRPQPDDPLFHDAWLSLDNVNIKLPVAPWRATNLVGQVLVGGSGAKARIDFNALRGRLENPKAKPAQLALLGHLGSGPDIARNLVFVVRDLELCEELGRSLSELGALDITTWSSLKPSGRVDLVTRSLTDEEGAEELEVVVQLVDVTSHAEMLPKPVEQLTGELHIENGELTFRDLRGLLGKTKVTCLNGIVQQLPPADGRTEISFDVHANNFPVDDGLANLFSGPLREAVRQRKLRGNVDIIGLSLKFSVPTADSSQPFTTQIGGDITLRGVDVLLGAGRDGIRIDDLQGDLTLSPSTVSDTGGELSGALTRGALSLFGHSFSSLAVDFRADATQLAIGKLTSRVAEGELFHTDKDSNAVTYLLPAANAPDGRLAARFDFIGVDVFSLLTDVGWENPPYSGTARGSVNLARLDGSTMIGAEADGNLIIERADLGKVPLFKAIYAQLPAADQPRFNFLDVAFRLTRDAINFNKLIVRSDILGAEGDGKLLLDGYLDVEMKLRNLLGQSADPLLMPLLEYLAQNLVTWRLYGHLRDLRAGTEFVGERTPTRQQVLPMPPARQKGKNPGY